MIFSKTPQKDEVIHTLCQLTPKLCDRDLLPAKFAYKHTAKQSMNYLRLNS